VSDLPPGWEATTTDALLEFVTSGSRGWARYYSHDGALFIRVGNLRRGSITPDLADAQRVSPPAGAEGIRTRVASNDILISITADLGRVALMPDVREPIYINQHVALARPVPGVNPRYLAWYLASEAVQQQWARQQRGVTKLGLGLDDIRLVDTPLPPLAEQERIVAVVEEQFSRIDAGVAAIDRVGQNLKGLRAAVLDAPYSRIPRDKWLPLNSVGKIVTGNTPSTKIKANYGGNLPFVTPSDFTHGETVTTGGRCLTDLGLRYARSLPIGTVLATCIGATLGKIALVNIDCATNQQINAVVPGPDVLPKYLFYALSRPSFTATMWREASSTTMPILNKSRFSELAVPIVPLPEQRAIVATIEGALCWIDQVIGLVSLARRRSDRIRTSILAAAFSGKLTHQDPTDEPASVLIERIAAQRATSNGHKPARGRTPRTKVTHER
jgi:type I restriction enzyme, S subunit